MPSFFSKLRRGRQQAKEHNAKQAQKTKEEQTPPAPAPAPYRHVPKHAGIDAMSGSHSTWNPSAHQLKTQELNRRKSMASIPTKSANTSSARLSYSPPSPGLVSRSIYGSPNHRAFNSSVRSLPAQRKTWQERMVVMSYSTDDLSDVDADTGKVKEKGKEKEKEKEKEKAKPTIYTPSGVSTPKSRAQSFVMPRSGMLGKQ
jgi:hypothetical protein